MTWLHLNHEALYLMEGGSEKYIDKVSLIQQEEGRFLINSFPYQWFTSETQRPKTLVLGLKNSNSIIPFSELCFLRLFEAPISNDSYTILKHAKCVPHLFEIFYNVCGGFTGDFFKYKSYKILPPVLTFPESAYHERPMTFPDFNYSDLDLDYQMKEPSFAEIMLWVAHKQNLSPRVYMNRFSNDPNVDSNVRVEFKFIESPLHSTQTKSVSLSTLDHSLVSRSFKCDINNPQLFEVVEILSHDWGIGVNLPTALRSRTVDLNVMESVTFAEMMDLIAATQDLAWDWLTHNSVILMSKQG